MKIDKKLKIMHKKYWELSQSFLKDFVKIQKEFMSIIDINDTIAGTQYMGGCTHTLKRNR